MSTPDPLPDLLPIFGAWRALANSRLDGEALAQVAASFGWVEEEPWGFGSDQRQFRPPGCELPVFLRAPAGRIQCASLTLSYWGDYAPSNYRDPLAHQAARSQFDALYTQASGVACGFFGQPFRTGVDRDEMAHQHSVWLTGLALVVVHQAALDVQYGTEINLWLARWTGGTPELTSPLVDWLTRLADRPESEHA